MGGKVFHAKFVAEDEIHTLFQLHSFCKPVGFEVIKKRIVVQLVYSVAASHTHVKISEESAMVF